MCGNVGMEGGIGPSHICSSGRFLRLQPSRGCDANVFRAPLRPILRITTEEDDEEVGRDEEVGNPRKCNIHLTKCLSHILSPRFRFLMSQRPRLPLASPSQSLAGDLFGGGSEANPASAPTSRFLRRCVVASLHGWIACCFGLVISGPGPNVALVGWPPRPGTDCPSSP